MQGFFAMLFAYTLPLILTIAVEAGGGLLFRLKKQEQHALLLCNLLTNPALNLALYLYQYFRSPVPPLALIALLECAVVLTEWQLLRRLCGTRRKWLFIALALNALSFGAGVILEWLLL